MIPSATDAAPASLPFEIEEVEPNAVREDVVSLYWELNRWPVHKSRKVYSAVWQWLHRGMGEGAPRVWVARPPGSNRVVGHIAVYPRSMSVAGQKVSVIVPGSLLVHPDYRNTLIGPRLVSHPRTLIKRGEADLAVAFANDAAHQMFQRLGFRDAGQFVRYTRVHSWLGVLRRRLGPAGPIGAVADLAFRSKKWGRPSNRPAPNLLVVELDSQDLDSFGIDHWRQSQTAESLADGAYLSARYLGSPVSARRIFALRDSDTSRLEGYVVVTRGAPYAVWDCRVNEDVLDTISAIRRVVDALPDVGRIIVDTLPNSPLARKLRNNGFTERQLHDDERRISAYWKPDHPLAAEFEKITEWSLLRSATHY